MTEAEWLAGDDPLRMLEYLRDQSHDRKVRLFACACCRTKWALLSDEACRVGIAQAERFADGVATRQAIKKTRRTVWDCSHVPHAMAVWHAADLWAWQGAAATAEALAPRIGSDRDAQGMEVQCELLRDIFGNPFRPVAVDPEWLTSTVVALARGVYDDRAFDRLPILADALQDAGCEDADILAHCRGDGPHVRGCWVVDLMLGKT